MTTDRYPGMRRSRRHISVFFPVLLIGLGVVVLLSNLQAIRWDVWDMIFIFWPVLFIAGGLDGLVRGENSVWQVFWIGVGVLLILGNLGHLPWSTWETLLRLWPIILIAAGLSLIAGHSLVASLLGMVLMAGVMVGAVLVLASPTAQARETDTIAQPLGGAARSNVTLAVPAGRLAVRAMIEPSAQLTATIRQPESMKLEQSADVKDGVAYLVLRTSGSSVWIPFGDRSNQLEWDVRLNPAVPTDLFTEIAAGEARIDLTGMNVAGLRSRTVVGTSQLVLPAEGRFQAEMSGVIGEMTILVPRGMQLRLRTDTALVSVQPPADYVRDGDTYTSPNVVGADSLVDLRVNLVLGRVTIRQFEP